MTIILIRHAHRDTTNRDLDNGLTAKGKSQAKALYTYFRERFGAKPKGVALYSSPKKRCVETLAPIAKSTGLKIRISELLIEQTGKESSSDLLKRCRRFFEQNDSACDVLVLCSHGDWIPLAAQDLCGARTEPKKGSWMEIEDGKLVRLLEPFDLS